jgi:hypothetical protein
MTFALGELEQSLVVNQNGSSHTCGKTLIFYSFNDKYPKAPRHSAKWHSAGNPYWRGRLSTVALLIEISSFVKKRKIFFSIRSNWFELVGTRRSIVLILPLQ